MTLLCDLCFSVVHPYINSIFFPGCNSYEDAVSLVRFGRPWVLRVRGIDD